MTFSSVCQDKYTPNSLDELKDIAIFTIVFNEMRIMESVFSNKVAVSLAGKARVNSISTGWIDTAYTVYEGPDAVQQPAGRVGNPKDISNMVLFLSSDKAGFITGENICIDGGMTRQMIYHGDCGWKLED